MPVLTLEYHIVVVNHVSFLAFGPSLAAIGVCRIHDWSSCETCHVAWQSSINLRHEKTGHDLFSFADILYVMRRLLLL